jgi:photosystem II stability/assembly factor-like uncharacterized protein
VGIAAAPPPPSFSPVSFTAIGENSYWLLGTVPCKARRCFSVVRTTDGGRTFARLAAPPLHPGVRTPILRFANRRDGYALVPGSRGVLFATHDGAATWRRVPLAGVLAFATGGGYAYAVTARGFERSPLSADAWHGRRLSFTPDGTVLDLTARGSYVWLLGTPAGSATSPNDVLARSSDGGRSFTTGRGPCVPGLGGKLEPVSSAVIWAVCPTGMSARASRSTDGGLTFTRVETPPLVNSAQLAPASSDVAVLAANGARSPLLRTTDDGATWTKARTPGTAQYVTWIGFTDARVGAALVQKGDVPALWRTTDGGGHWASVRVP